MPPTHGNRKRPRFYGPGPANRDYQEQIEREIIEEVISDPKFQRRLPKLEKLEQIFEIVKDAPHLFELGIIENTDKADGALVQLEEIIALYRHRTGDFGLEKLDSVRMNLRAIESGEGSVVSSFKSVDEGTPFIVMTELLGIKNFTLIMLEDDDNNPETFSWKFPKGYK